MRRIGLFIIAMVGVLLIWSYINELNYSSFENGTADLIQYETFDELINNSQLVAEVKIKDEPELVDYAGATFTLNNIIVKDVIIGDTSLKNNEITLLELGNYNNNDLSLTKSNKNYILFLKKYEGSVTNKDAYTVVGLYQGKFEIDKNNKLKYVGDYFNGIKYFQDDLNNLTLEEAKEILRNYNR